MNIRRIGKHSRKFKENEEVIGFFFVSLRAFPFCLMSELLHSVFNNA